MLVWGWWIFTDSIFNANLEVIINALSKSWWKVLTGNLSNTALALSIMMMMMMMVMVMKYKWMMIMIMIMTIFSLAISPMQPQPSPSEQTPSGVRRDSGFGWNSWKIKVKLKQSMHPNENRKVHFCKDESSHHFAEDRLKSTPVDLQTV